MRELYRFALERDELEKKLGGGIPPGSLILVEGESGSGKSTICQRLAYGLLEAGHTVTYISTQLTTKGFINQMYSLNYPIASHLLRGNLIYIPVLPLINAPKSREDFIERLMSAKKLFESDVIIIDTLSALIKASINSKKELELISFFKKINGLGKVIIVTVDPAQLEEESLLVLRSSCDIYLQLKIKTLGTEIKRSIFVNKFTGARKRVAPLIGFRIEPNVGFVVEISAVS
ncbi:ATPase [Methanosarcinales archaeon]|nr:MAG: ATPase [Methanosarcinales archaeon]